MGLLNLFSSSNDDHGITAAAEKAPRGSAARGTWNATVGGQRIAGGLTKREARQVADAAARDHQDSSGWWHW